MNSYEKRYINPAVGILKGYNSLWKVYERGTISVKGVTFCTSGRNLLYNVTNLRVEPLHQVFIMLYKMAQTFSFRIKPSCVAIQMKATCYLSLNWVTPKILGRETMKKQQGKTQSV